jgi:hypothetical protein
MVAGVAVDEEGWETARTGLENATETPDEVRARPRQWWPLERLDAAGSGSARARTRTHHLVCGSVHDDRGSVHDDRVRVLVGADARARDRPRARERAPHPARSRCWWGSVTEMMPACVRMGWRHSQTRHPVDRRGYCRKMDALRWAASMHWDGEVHRCAGRTVAVRSAPRMRASRMTLVCRAQHPYHQQVKRRSKRRTQHYPRGRSRSSWWRGREIDGTENTLNKINVVSLHVWFACGV